MTLTEPPQTVIQIERRIQECLKSFAASKDEAVKDRLRRRIDELLDERNEVTA